MARFELSAHPISIFLEWARQHHGLELEFSEYVYVPRSLVDQRRPFRLPARDLTASWLEERLSALSPGWELALHSRVYHRRQISHIRMIDFVSFTTDARRTLDGVLPGIIDNSLYIFASGRSFHGYSLELLDPVAWIRFMGTLLLCNLPDKPPVVDQRWIGHRLIAGYAALRWSCNTVAYHQYPQLVEAQPAVGTHH